jgi:hypothetical protein
MLSLVPFKLSNISANSLIESTPRTSFTTNSLCQRNRQVPVQAIVAVAVATVVVAAVAVATEFAVVCVGFVVAKVGFVVGEWEEFAFVEILVVVVVEMKTALNT